MVARAHGREFLICRRFKREMKSSIDVAISCCFSDLKNVARDGALLTVTGAMVCQFGQSRFGCGKTISVVVSGVLVEVDESR